QMEQLARGHGAVAIFVGAALPVEQERVETQQPGAEVADAVAVLIHARLAPGYQTSSASSSPMLAATTSTSLSTSSRVMQSGGASRTTWPRAETIAPRSHALRSRRAGGGVSPGPPRPAGAPPPPPPISPRPPPSPTQPPP